MTEAEMLRGMAVASSPFGPREEFGFEAEPEAANYD